MPNNASSTAAAAVGKRRTQPSAKLQSKRARHVAADPAAAIGCSTEAMQVDDTLMVEIVAAPAGIDSIQATTGQQGSMEGDAADMADAAPRAAVGSSGGGDTGGKAAKAKAIIKRAAKAGTPSQTSAQPAAAAKAGAAASTAAPAKRCAPARACNAQPAIAANGSSVSDAKPVSVPDPAAATKRAPAAKHVRKPARSGAATAPDGSTQPRNKAAPAKAAANALGETSTAAPKGTSIAKGTAVAGKENALQNGPAGGSAKPKQLNAAAKPAAATTTNSSGRAGTSTNAAAATGTAKFAKKANARSATEATTDAASAEGNSDVTKRTKANKAERYVFHEDSMGTSKTPEDLLQVLEAAAKEHEAGEEPWRCYQGLTVNEQPLVDDERKAAVAATSTEFWRRYRLAVSTEDKRVSRILAERAAQDAADAGNPAGGDGDDDNDDGENEEANGASGAKKDAKKYKALSKRPDRVAEAEMLRAGAAINRGKIFGHVPGIDVNDRFILRSEILCLGLHQTPMGGIAYVGASDVMKMTKGALNRPVAVSVVVSGNYEDDKDGHGDGNEIIYTGEGGNNYLGNKRQIKGQELVRGNAALVGNYELGVPVRILRKNVDTSSFYGHVYVYDGLYNVVSLCKAVGNSGFLVWKYLMRRRDDQPESKSKPIEFGGVTSAPPKAHVLNRANIICTDLSKGLERKPVVVVNEIDRELPPGLDPETDSKYLVNDMQQTALQKAPYDMKYVVQYNYDTGIQPPKPPSSCSHSSHTTAAASSCLTRMQQQAEEEEEEEEESPHEIVFRLNAGRMPYVGDGISDDAKSLLVECGDWTGCKEGSACKQREIQRGLRYRLEVFKTQQRGWAVRSWDSIRAGAFVVAFYGRVVRVEDAGEGRRYGDDTYFFEMTRRTDLSDDHKQLKDPRVFEQKYIIDAKYEGGVARFINHSCSPNLYVQPFCAGHVDYEMPGIALFAMKPIQPWEELAYDYGEQYVINNLGGVCHCGAPACQFKEGNDMDGRQE